MKARVYRPNSFLVTLTLCCLGVSLTAATGCSKKPSDTETNAEMRKVLSDPGVGMDKLPPERQKALRAQMAAGNGGGSPSAAPK